MASSYEACTTAASIKDAHKRNKTFIGAGNQLRDKWKAAVNELTSAWNARQKALEQSAVEATKKSQKVGKKATGSSPLAELFQTLGTALPTVSFEKLKTEGFDWVKEDTAVDATPY
eukprot:13984977-Alexandrium_andersonii.AAC.1